MDNAAYFFTGVLAGIAGLTLSAVLDNKYGFITGTPTAANDTNPNVVIIYKENHHPSAADKQPEQTKDENTATKINVSNTDKNISAQPTDELAVA